MKGRNLSVFPSNASIEALVSNMKSIDTLIPDISKSLEKALKEGGDPHTPTAVAALGVDVGDKLLNKLKGEVTEDRLAKKIIRASELGINCKRKLWYKFHPSEVKHSEPLSLAAQIKFIYGDMIEELVLFLARLAGHRVEHQQRRVEIPLSNGWSVRGHIDATIDGELVDVKSCSSYGFEKIKNGLSEDAFGYRNQLGAYSFDPVLVPKDRCFIIPVDKTLGKIDLVKFDKSHLPQPDHLATYDLISAATGDKPPRRGHNTVEEKKTGLRKLPMECSYCQFKHDCWGTGLRMHTTYKGPVWYVEGH